MIPLGVLKKVPTTYLRILASGFGGAAVAVVDVSARLGTAEEEPGEVGAGARGFCEAVIILACWSSASVA